MALLSFLFYKFFRRLYMRLNSRFDNMLLTMLISTELLIETVLFYTCYYRAISAEAVVPIKRNPMMGRSLADIGLANMQARAAQEAAALALPTEYSSSSYQQNVAIPGVNQLAPIAPLAIQNLPATSAPPDSDTCPREIRLLPDGRVPLSDRTKFLLPIVKWGPNNQILGFYEAMHLSNFLGTKLVLPPFYFHESDFKRNKELESVIGEIRVNAEGIDNLVTLNDYKQYCGEKPEAVLLATDVLSGSLPGRILKFQELAGMKIVHKPKGSKFYTFYDDIAQYPRIEEIQKRYAEGDNFVRQTWRETFRYAAQDNRCLMFVLPFRTIIKPPREIWSPAPAYEYSPIVKEVAESFIKAFGGNIKTGAHWRYNKGDWSHRCATGGSKKLPEECKLMDHLNYKKVAQNLCDVAEKSTQGADIYIAAPLSERDIIAQVASNATNGIRIFNSNQMVEFAQKKYGLCEWFPAYEGEIISLVEQAILSQVKEFMPWPTSSWSSRIGDYRAKIGLRNSRYNLMEIFGKSLI